MEKIFRAKTPTHPGSGHGENVPPNAQQPRAAPKAPPSPAYKNKCARGWNPNQRPDEPQNFEYIRGQVKLDQIFRGCAQSPVSLIVRRTPTDDNYQVIAKHDPRHKPATYKPTNTCTTPPVPKYTEGFYNPFNEFADVNQSMISGELVQNKLFSEAFEHNIEANSRVIETQPVPDMVEISAEVREIETTVVMVDEPQPEPEPQPMKYELPRSFVPSTLETCINPIHKPQPEKADSPLHLYEKTQAKVLEIETTYQPPLLTQPSQFSLPSQPSYVPQPSQAPQPSQVPQSSQAPQPSQTSQCSYAQQSSEPSLETRMLRQVPESRNSPLSLYERTTAKVLEMESKYTPPQAVAQKPTNQQQVVQSALRTEARDSPLHLYEKTNAKVLNMELNYNNRQQQPRQEQQQQTQGMCCIRQSAPPQQQSVQPAQRQPQQGYEATVKAATTTQFDARNSPLHLYERTTAMVLDLGNKWHPSVTQNQSCPQPATNREGTQNVIQMSYEQTFQNPTQFQSQQPSFQGQPNQPNYQNPQPQVNLYQPAFHPPVNQNSGCFPHSVQTSFQTYQNPQFQGAQNPNANVQQTWSSDGTGNSSYMSSTIQLDPQQQAGQPLVISCHLEERREIQKRPQSIAADEEVQNLCEKQFVSAYYHNTEEVVYNGRVSIETGSVYTPNDLTSFSKAQPSAEAGVKKPAVYVPKATPPNHFMVNADPRHMASPKREPPPSYGTPTQLDPHSQSETDDDGEPYHKIPVKNLISTFEQSARPIMRYKQIQEQLPIPGHQRSTDHQDTDPNAEGEAVREDGFQPYQPDVNSNYIRNDANQQHSSQGASDSQGDGGNVGSNHIGIGATQHSNQPIVAPNQSAYDSRRDDGVCASNTSQEPKTFVAEKLIEIPDPIPVKQLIDTFEHSAVQQSGLNRIGAHQNGALQTGAHQNGAHQSGTHQNGAQQSGVQQNGAQQNGAQQNGLQQNGVQQGGADQSGAQQSGESAVEPFPPPGKITFSCIQ